MFNGETIEEWVLLSGKQGEGQEGNINIILSFTVKRTAQTLHTLHQGRNKHSLHTIPCIYFGMHLCNSQCIYNSLSACLFMQYVIVLSNMIFIYDFFYSQHLLLCHIRWHMVTNLLAWLLQECLVLKCTMLVDILPHYHNSKCNNQLKVHIIMTTLHTSHGTIYKAHPC